MCQPQKPRSSVTARTSSISWPVMLSLASARLDLDSLQFVRSGPRIGWAKPESPSCVPSTTSISPRWSQDGPSPGGYGCPNIATPHPLNWARYWHDFMPWTYRIRPSARLSTPLRACEIRSTVEVPCPRGTGVWLRDLAERLRTEYMALVPELPRCVIHGDAWQGNVVVPGAGDTPVLLDLDHIGVGPREWDLVSLAVDYTDFGRIAESDYQAFVRAYGGYDMTVWSGYRTLATARELRWTAFVLGKGTADREAAEEARHRVACLRGEINRPWSWSAF